MAPLFFLLLSLSACSLYRSEGRKSFETKAEENLDLQSLQQMQCDEISAVQYWYETSLPKAGSEWVEPPSESLEVWLRHDSSGRVLVQSYEQTQPHITRCNIAFASRNEWQKFQAFYFKSIEGAKL